jgi:Alginate export
MALSQNRLWRRLALAATAAALATPAAAQAPVPDDPAPARPAILFNRWQEDWSVLADPRVASESLDSLKYIPFASDPKDYLSFGADQRLRFESNNAGGFGTGPNRDDNYVLSRTELDADLHVDAVQAFLQLESTSAPGKARLSSVDQNRLDIEEAFVAVTEPVGDGILKVRVGRQQFAFDLQRFVSVRDGPNDRQSFDAAWVDYELPKWRFIGYLTQPVVTHDEAAFDDRSSGHLTFSGVRVERKVFGADELSAYWSRFTQDQATYLGRTGRESRDVFDVRFAGVAGPLDWDLEGMGQTGDFAGETIAAWGVGSRAGYTFSGIAWTPRLGLQLDAASGDSDPSDRKLGTFNALFPNGNYVTLAGYTGYVNFIHLKPSVTVRPAPKLTVMAAVAGQWRETTADAVYTQPNVPVAGTAGAPGRYTGTYGQLRLDYLLNAHITTSVEAVRFVVGDVIRRAGGHDADYLGVELKLGW